MKNKIKLLVPLVLTSQLLACQLEFGAKQPVNKPHSATGPVVLNAEQTLKISITDNPDSIQSMVESQGDESFDIDLLEGFDGQGGFLEVVNVATYNSEEHEDVKLPTDAIQVNGTIMTIIPEEFDEMLGYDQSHTFVIKYSVNNDFVSPADTSIERIIELTVTGAEIKPLLEADLKPELTNKKSALEADITALNSQIAALTDSELDIAEGIKLNKVLDEKQTQLTEVERQLTHQIWTRFASDDVIEIPANYEYQLTPLYVPATTTFKNVQWQLDNNDVADIDEFGTLRTFDEAGLPANTLPVTITVTGTIGKGYNSENGGNLDGTATRTAKLKVDNIKDNVSQFDSVFTAQFKIVSSTDKPLGIQAIKANGDPLTEGVSIKVSQGEPKEFTQDALYKVLYDDNSLTNEDATVTFASSDLSIFTIEDEDNNGTYTLTASQKGNASIIATTTLTSGDTITNILPVTSQASANLLFLYNSNFENNDFNGLLYEEGTDELTLFDNWKGYWHQWNQKDGFGSHNIVSVGDPIPVDNIVSDVNDLHPNEILSGTGSLRLDWSQNDAPDRNANERTGLQLDFSDGNHITLNEDIEYRLSFDATLNGVQDLDGWRLQLLSTDAVTNNVNTGNLGLGNVILGNSNNNTSTNITIPVSSTPGKYYWTIKFSAKQDIGSIRMWDVNTPTDPESTLFIDNIDLRKVEDIE